MISLRQHIFSLVAVFVALAIGIAAGSTVVRGPLLDSTRARLESAEKLIEAERAENDLLAAEVNQLDDLGDEGPAQLLTGRLGTSPAMLIVAGDVDTDVIDGVVRSLSSATSGFIGELRLDPAVFDPSAAARVATEIGATDLLPASGDPTADQTESVRTAFGDRIANLLTQVTSAAMDTGNVTAAMNTAFGGLEDAGLVDLLRVTTSTVQGDALGIVVLTDRNLAHDPTAVLQALLNTPADQPAPVYVVAEVGRIAQDNGEPAPSFVGSIRESGRLRDEFSTVDNAETVLGWVAIVLGLVAAEAGEVGQYGFRDGADGPIPRLLP